MYTAEIENEYVWETSWSVSVELVVAKLFNIAKGRDSKVIIDTSETKNSMKVMKFL